MQIMHITQTMIKKIVEVVKNVDKSNERKIVYVSGGIMQTEEVVPRVQSTGIDGSLTDSTTFQDQIHRSPLLQCSLPSPVLMAVKQEPQEDDERARDTNTLR